MTERCRLFLFLMGLAVGAGAAAQGPAAANAERARILTERQQIEKRSAAQEAECYQRFAVNSCLQEAKAKRRAELQDLRRQEISLNDAERKARGAAQAQQVQDRLAQRSDADAAPAPGVTPSPRERKLAEKLRSQGGSASLAEKRVTRGARTAKPGKVQSGSSQAAARYAQKMQEAAQRQKEREARAAARKKPPAAPLPQPG